MTKEARQRKRDRYNAKFAPYAPCICGSERCFSESWKGREIWECATCKRTVYADTKWETSVGWYLGMTGKVDGLVKPWNEQKEQPHE